MSTFAPSGAAGVSLDFNLHPAQSEIHLSDARFKVVAAGRRFGKSYYAAVMAIAEVLKNEHVGTSGKKYDLTTESDVWYVTPYFKQAKDIFEEKIKNMAKGLISKYNATEGVITFINGRKLKLKGADNPDSLRGAGLSYVILDEYADMDGSVWDEIIRPMLMDVEGGALFIGTPKGKNHFYELFTKAERDTTGEWGAWTFDSYANSTLLEKEIESTIDGATEHTAKQEIEAKFISLGGGYLDPDKLKLDPHEPEDGYFVVTADLAGFANAGRSKTKEIRDNSAIVTAKVHSGGIWIKEIDYGQWDVRETAFRLGRTAIRHYVPYVGVEKGISRQAVEPYFNDYCMRQIGRPLPIQDLSHGNQKKEDRIHWSLSGYMAKGEVQINAKSFGEKPWVMQVRQEMADFPDLRSHDDLIDAMAYITQMPKQAMEYFDEEDYLEPYDEAIGY